MGDDDDSLAGMEALLGQNLRGELHPLGPGMIIDGKWELLERLGKGSFGEVYEAWHVKLGTPAAIKVLLGEHWSADAKQRFLEEAQLMAGMSSEHLVRATDYGELPDGSPYFVMDLVKGKSLRHALAERLELGRALKIGEEILEGLVAVHRCGVVHGDIKPENVVIGDDDDKARLLDFGLAQTSAAGSEDVGGTPHYMAPEMLFDGSPASVRTDVYAVGAVLYEMLTGRLPRGHLGMRGAAKLREAWESKPKANPMLMHSKEVPEAQRGALEVLDKLVMDALARDPTQRPKSAQPMLEELRRLRRRLSSEGLASTLSAESVGDRAPSELRSTQPLRALNTPVATSRWVFGVFGVAVVAGLVWWGWPEPVPDPPPVVSPVVEKELVAADLGGARGGILVAVAKDTPDETYQAFCAALGGGRPRVEGVLPVFCSSVPAMEADALVALADEAQVRVVVIVRGEQLEVRSTSHHRGNPLVARLDGLPLPADPAAMKAVTPVLEAVMEANGAEAEIPALEWRQVGARWGVLAEWIRVQQGSLDHEDLERRGELERVLEDKLSEERARREGEEVAGFYRDLAVLVRASSVACDAAEPMLRGLSKPEEHETAMRVAALLGLVACLMEGDDAAAKAVEAEARLVEAFEASGNDPCVRVAAIGSISWIDHWKGGDALWEAHAAQLPGSECGAATSSSAFSVRGDALVASKRWGDAASAYARAYGSQVTRVEPLLAWAEYDWLARPELGASRQELLASLGRALASESFTRPEQQVSLTYMRWWLTRDPADAQRVVDAYAGVKVGEVALIEGVASDLEPEICKGVKGDACSRRILERPKQAGDDARLREGLGLR